MKRMNGRTKNTCCITGKKRIIDEITKSKEIMQHETRKTKWMNDTIKFMRDTAFHNREEQNG